MRAFTLIELLIVLLILSIVSTFAMLGLSTASKMRALQTKTQQLAQTLRLAHDEAVLMPETIGVFVVSHGLGFYRYDAEKAIWQRLKSTALPEFVFSSEVKIQLTREDKSQVLSEDTVSTVPQIIFAVTGKQTPFVLSFKLVSEKTIFSIDGKSTGEITWRETVLP